MRAFFLALGMTCCVASWAVAAGPMRFTETDAAKAFEAARRHGAALAGPVRRLVPALGRRGTR